MTSENSNWVVGENGTITEILEKEGKVVIAFDGREDDYTVFVSDFKIEIPLPIGKLVFVPEEKTTATILNHFTSSNGGYGYELKFSDGEEGNYLANEISEIPQLLKRFRLYLNGKYFHGGYDSLEEAKTEIPFIVKGFSKEDILKISPLKWSIQDIEENETIIIS